MLRVSDDHRRARLASRHGLAPWARYDDIAAATTAMTAWHATDPPTVHMSIHARVHEITVEDVERELYTQRSLVKQMAMRRTLFAVDRVLLPYVVGSAGVRVAEAERRRLAKEAAAHADSLGGPEWIEAASQEVMTTLAGQALSTRELRDALPHLGGTFTVTPGTRWEAEVPFMNRLVTILSAAGELVRGPNAIHWRLSRPQWARMADWLGHELTPTDATTGYAALVRRLLWTFGPVTEADLVWWLGSTKTAVRQALKEIEPVVVELDDTSAAYVLPGDTADLERPAEAEPWVALTATLDPTTMGWRGRDWYVDPKHVPYLFDSAGNGGQMVWVNGRIVGCWVQDEQGAVQPVLLETVPAAAMTALDVEVKRLDALLRGERIVNVYASPQMRGARLY